jgi:translocation and assembly module TamB
MSDESPVVAVTPSRGRRVLRIVGRTLAGLLALLVVVGVTGYWLLGREATLQRIVAEGEKALGGQLKVDGVTGSLYDRIAFRRLVFRSKTQVITLDDGALRYRLEPFARRFTVIDAHAAKLTIETIAKSTEPASEPDTLALPAALHLDTLRLDAVHLGALALGSGDQTTLLGPADLVGEYGSDGGSTRWAIERLAIQTPWGKAEARAKLDAHRPFAIDATIDASGTVDDVPYRAPLVVRGKLADLALSSDFTVSDPTHAPLAGHMEARVLTFREQPIDRATLHASGLSPKRWKDTLPEADITVDATIAPVVSPPSGAGRNPFEGTLRVANAAPGPVDRGRIPVVALEAALHGDALALVVDRLRADLGAAGALEGHGRYGFSDSGLAFDGAVTRLDAKAIQTTLIPTRFSGPIVVAQRAGSTSFETTLTDVGRRIAAKGVFADRKLTLTMAQLTVGGSHVDATGKLDLADDRPFEVAAKLAHVDSHDFGDFAKADLNAALKVDGTLGRPAEARRPEAFVVKADVRIDPSHVLGRPLAGSLVGRVAGAIAAAAPKGKSPVTLRQIDGAHVALALGANRVTADGDFGRPADLLRWTVDAPRLAEIQSGLAGAVKGSGSLGGTLEAPSLDFTVAGDGLRYTTPVAPAATKTTTAIAAPTSTTTSLASLRANGRLQPGQRGAVDVTASLSDLRDGQPASPTLRTASLRIQGTRDAHRIDAAAASDRFDVVLVAAGGLDATETWRGVVSRLENRGRVPFALAGSMPLVTGAQQVRVGAATFRFADSGEVDLDHLDYLDDRLDTAGRATGFPLAIVGAFSKDLATRLSTTLKFGASWNLRAGDQVDGKLRVFRESGNLRFLTEPRQDVDVEQLALDADIVADRVAAHLVARARGVGNVDATFTTTLAKRDGQWRLPSDAPFMLASTLDVPDLRGVARLSGVQGLDAGGSLSANVSGQGTVGHPSLGGQATGQALALRWPEQGVAVHDGRFELAFEGDRIVLRQATIAAGRGSMTASGDLRLADGNAVGSLAVAFEHFEAVARSDRTMIVSGTGGLRFGATGIDVTGDVKADRGVLQLVERHGPTMSDDIVIVGREAEADADMKAPEKSVPVRFEIKFDMGDDFGVKGSGFDGKLGGSIRLTGTGSDLRALGTVTVREGTYEGYGQKLTITRGNLSFSGPIDNPALDILAVRKNLAVEAGVQVSGTALAPVAKLTSTPDVPDSEKLSWLMLGHGLAGATKSDYATLASAAASLFGASDSTGIQSRIAATLGVDEVGFTTDSTTGAGLLTIGKQISSRLRVNLEQGLTKTATLIKVRYNIYQRVDLQVTAGTESALDIFYTFSFR